MFNVSTISTRLPSAGPLRTSPETMWWADVIPLISIGVLVASVLATALFLPKVLRGGLSGAAVMRALVGSSTKTAEPPAGAAPTLTSLGDDPSDPSPGTAPTWADMDLSIFDEDEIPPQPEH